MKRILILALILGGLFPAAAPASASRGWVAPPRDGWLGHLADPARTTGCDPIDPAQCLLPYPNDWFTRPDATSATGRRLDLQVQAMPRNAAGEPIEPQEWNRSDGFSAGATILTVVPNMTRNGDLAPSGLPPVTDLGMNGGPDLGVILLDTRTGEQWPVWCEIDQYTQEAGVLPAAGVQQDLMIHPARNLTDGDTYIVGLRHLVTDAGNIAQPSAAFERYVDGRAGDARAAHMEEIFETLEQAGWNRHDLYLAWDFTTASTENVTGRLLAIRNDAFERVLGASAGAMAAGQVDGAAPQFTVDSVTDYTASDNANIARQIAGHFTVPCYIFPSCEPPAKCASLPDYPFDDYCPEPGQFLLDPTNPDATPQQVAGQTYSAPFLCNVGRTAYENHQLLRPVEYGHGLFGSASEINSDAETSMAERFGMMYCATAWFGFASPDIPNAVLALQDLSHFTFLTDRTQEGQLAFLLLQRLMAHPQGFAANPAFQYPDGSSFIDPSGVYYDGNSQGGIFGGTVCAVSIDVKRCVLGVPGMDYSTLLPRSSDYVALHALSGLDPTTFDPGNPTQQIGYSNLFDASYPDQAKRQLILQLLQTLWDRSDPDGYATHMTTDPLPGTPVHHVLMQMGYGDHQVANITAEDEARTIGAETIAPPLVTWRSAPYLDPFWNITPIAAFPYDGSAVVMFDSGPPRGANPDGTCPPPTSDVPNRTGLDPHEGPRRSAWGQVQKSNFLSVGGVVTNPQPGGAPYLDNGIDGWSWNGVDGQSAESACPSN